VVSRNGALGTGSSGLSIPMTQRHMQRATARGTATGYARVIGRLLAPDLCVLQLDVHSVCG
jgi:hypothetical protein